MIERGFNAQLRWSTSDLERPPPCNAGSGVRDPLFESAVAVWDAQDIKSATDNSGAFGEGADITRSTPREAPRQRPRARLTPSASRCASASRCCARSPSAWADAPGKNPMHAAPAAA